MANPFQEIKAEAGGQNRSADWYMKAVREYANTINTPVEVFNSGIGEFVNTLDVGYMYMFGLKTDGTLWAWGGAETDGTLGLNSIIKRSSPTQVPGTWTEAYGFFGHSAAVKQL